MSKLIIGKMDIAGTSCVYTALVENNRLVEFHFQEEETKSILNNIYVGQVDKRVDNIQSAFVKISPHMNCYYSLKEEDTAIFANPKNNRKLVAGDQVLVQVNRDAVKEKLPSVTTNLSFTGKYLVITSGKKLIGYSRKLLPQEKQLLGKWLEEAGEEGTSYGIVVRTNAAHAEKQAFLKELEYLKGRYEQIMTYGASRTCYSLLEEEPPFYISVLRDTYGEGLEEIITDVPSLYEIIQSYMAKHQSDDLQKLRLYEDSTYPLMKLYSMEKKFQDICRKKVWLNSGGFLMIEPTEAFVSIDVNTGKFIGKKKAGETYRMINLEAAKEIAYQLRVRNLSGIILIDFINMTNYEHVDELLHVLQKYLRKDPVKARVHDMTALNIVEVTRMKIERPVHEQLQLLYEGMSY